MQPDPEVYLSPCDVVDFLTPEVAHKAAELSGNDPTDTARRCFEFVRDEVRHSGDHRLNPVTCRASDVLARGTGFCYAKSHLLCALLRANGIPAGLCYQRLRTDAGDGSFCLHGLNAVFLPEFGWYRVDSRGNRGDVDAQFMPPCERLAFGLDQPGETDLPVLYVRPLTIVVEALQTNTTWDALCRNLPDVKFAEGQSDGK